VRAYRIAYDGQHFHGFQRQPDVSTVEDAILDGLRALDVLDDTDTPPGYAAAGRTDAGVSARAQTIAFEAPDWLTPAALNSELPAEVRAWASADALDGFHATHDAASRTYTYYLHAPEADEGRARETLDALSGEHDFHNLTPDETGTVRTLSTGIEREGEMLVVRLTAGGFARQLARRVVSVVAEVARGERDAERIKQVLGETELTGPAGGAPAPAQGLVLTDVTYPNLTFDIDSEATASARAVFGGRRVEHATLSRVAAHIEGVKNP